MAATPSAAAGRGLRLASRVAAGLLGGYAFCWSFTALGITALVALGVDFHEAETALLLLAFVLFLLLFLWAFSARSVARAWTLLGAGAVLMSAAAWGLQRFLLS
ncbi:iron uptake protein [Azohydromonas aeria]|uniref:iron uptake protein n=1 Tax=Azohydromonas aeria TaxID=2590212 RepID=UPI001E3BF8FD|nr:iron uptake protein [Azohydromonas aeria]